jgi:hypothetical protein
MLSTKKDIGSHIKFVIAGAGVASASPAIVTAGGAGDATKVTGQTIDRMGYESLSLGIGYYAELADTKTLAFAVEYQFSADGSNWDTAVVVQASTVKATGATPTTDYHGVAKYDLDLQSLGSAMKRYIRFNITPDLSNTASDLATWVAIAALGGADVLPAA